MKTFCWFKAMVQRAKQPVPGCEVVGVGASKGVGDRG